MEEKYDKDFWPPYLDNIYEITKVNTEADPFMVGVYFDSFKDCFVAMQPEICSKCGSTSFEVAQGDRRTAIRCPTCKWEAIIHEG